MGAEESVPAVHEASAPAVTEKLTFVIENINYNNHSPFLLIHHSGNLKGQIFRKRVSNSKLIELAQKNDLLISYDNGISFEKAKLTTQTIDDDTTVDDFEKPLHVDNLLRTSYDLLNQRGGKLFSVKKKFKKFKKSKKFSQKSKYLMKTNKRKKKSSYKNFEFK